MPATRAQNCANNLHRLDNLRALKARFDAAFEELVRTGRRDNFEVVEKLEVEITEALQHSVMATNINEINEYTLKYVGDLEPGIFKRLPAGIEIYTQPGMELMQTQLITGDKKFPKLLNYLESEHEFTPALRQMLDHRDFTLGTQPKRQNFIFLTAADLGFSDVPVWGEIIGNSDEHILGRAQELGLELCAPETAPQLVVQMVPANFPLGEIYIGMQPITLDDRKPRVFAVTIVDVGENDDYGNYDAWMEVRLHARATDALRTQHATRYMFRLPENE